MDGEKKLTAKEERFCMEFIVDHNATQAAIRAGYSERSAGVTACKLLKKANVSARVREFQEEFNKTRCFEEKSRVLAEAWETFERATQKTQVMEWDYDERKYVPTGEWAFDGKTATKCLEIIAKMGGMLTDKVNVGANPEGSGEVKFCIEVKKTGDTLGTE